MHADLRVPRQDFPLQHGTRSVQKLQCEIVWGPHRTRGAAAGLAYRNLCVRILSFGRASAAL